METGPKIQLTLSKTQRMMESASVVFMVIMWTWALYAYTVMPEIIPIHFNHLGLPDNHGRKTTILLLPLIATAIYAGITWLNKRPHILNYPMTITEDNAPKMYAGATGMLRFLKLAILILFTVIVLFTYLVAMGFIKSIGAWFLPLILSIFLLPTLIMLINSFKITKSEKRKQNPV